MPDPSFGQLKLYDSSRDLVARGPAPPPDEAPGPAEAAAELVESRPAAFRTVSKNLAAQISILAYKREEAGMRGAGAPLPLFRRR